MSDMRWKSLTDTRGMVLVHLARSLYTSNMSARKKGVVFGKWLSESTSADQAARFDLNGERGNRPMCKTLLLDSPTFYVVNSQNPSLRAF